MKECRKCENCGLETDELDNGLCPACDSDASEKEGKPYCECGKDANMGSNDTNYQCFTCCKPNYATWFSNKMNKKDTPANIHDCTEVIYHCRYCNKFCEGNRDEDFQKIPKEDFEGGISDTASSYQAGYIAGKTKMREEYKDELLNVLQEKKKSYWHLHFDGEPQDRIRYINYTAKKFNEEVTEYINGAIDDIINYIK